MNKQKANIPMVVEPGPNGERAYDIYSMLLKERIISLHSDVNEYTSSVITAQMLYLAHLDPEKDIHFYINSPGGEIYHGLAIYDTMQLVQPDIATYGVGVAASMASVLLAAGAKDKRFALPNSSVMIHQPMSGAYGQASDIEISAKETLRLRDKLYSILTHHTGQEYEKIKKNSDRDCWMDAQAAKEYGIVDTILAKSIVPK